MKLTLNEGEVMQALVNYLCAKQTALCSSGAKFTGHFVVDRTKSMTQFSVELEIVE
jgi:hypothetical protein